MAIHVVGNYFEERYLSEQYGLETDFNREGSRAAQEFKRVRVFRLYHLFSLAQYVDITLRGYVMA